MSQRNYRTIFNVIVPVRGIFIEYIFSFRLSSFYKREKLFDIRIRNYIYEPIDGTQLKQLQLSTVANKTRCNRYNIQLTETFTHLISSPQNLFSYFCIYDPFQISLETQQ